MPAAEPTVKSRTDNHGQDAGAPAVVRRHPLASGWAAIAAGAVALAVLATAGPPPQRGTVEFGARIDTDTPAVAPTDPRTAPGAGVPIAAGDLPTPRAVVPVRLEVPAIGVVASVRPVGLHPLTGEVDVPRSVDTVGWYRFGPDLAADGGSIVVAGHVDSATQGAGAFFKLRDLQAGDRAIVTGSDREPKTFVIVSRQVFAKTSAPLDRIFARDGPRRLTLITCGGSFDRASSTYRDNVVVTAVPA